MISKSIRNLDTYFWVSYAESDNLQKPTLKWTFDSIIWAVHLSQE